MKLEFIEDLVLCVGGRDILISRGPGITCRGKDKRWNIFFTTCCCNAGGDQSDLIRTRHQLSFFYRPVYEIHWIRANVTTDSS